MRQEVSILSAKGGFSAEMIDLMALSTAETTSLTTPWTIENKTKKKKKRAVRALITGPRKFSLGRRSHETRGFDSFCGERFRS